MWWVQPKFLFKVEVDTSAELRRYIPLILVGQRGSYHLVQAEAGVGLVLVVAHQQHEDEGRDAEDEAGEAEHDGGDHLLQPGRHAPRHRAGGGGAGGVLQPVQGARIARARPPLQPGSREMKWGDKFPSPLFRKSK